MQSRNAGNSSPRYFVSRLEALRGVAAMMVALWHSMWVLNVSGLQGVTTACISRLCNGLAAVTLFFMLSGFVLGLSLRNAGEGSWKLFWGFSVRRFFRIYPVFFFSTLCVVVFVFCSPYLGGLIPPWFGTAPDYNRPELNPGRPPGLIEVFLNFALWVPTLNYPTWTLGIELRCSVLLAVLHCWAGRFGWTRRALLLFALMALATVGKWCLLLGWVRAEAIFAFFSTGFAGYLFLFYMGYLLPEVGPKLFAELSASKAGRILVPLGSAIVLLWAEVWGDEFRLLQGVAAAMLIGDLVYGRERSVWRILDNALVKFYGRISFSFYLWHDLVLLVSARLLFHYFPPGAQLGSSLLYVAALLSSLIVLTTAVASFCFKFIESPCIALGKRLTANLLQSRRGLDSQTQSASSPLSTSPALEPSTPIQRAA